MFFKRKVNELSGKENLKKEKSILELISSRNNEEEDSYFLIKPIENCPNGLTLSNRDPFLNLRLINMYPVTENYEDFNYGFIAIDDLNNKSAIIFNTGTRIDIPKKIECLNQFSIFDKIYLTLMTSDNKFILIYFNERNSKYIIVDNIQFGKIYIFHDFFNNNSGYFIIEHEDLTMTYIDIKIDNKDNLTYKIYRDLTKAFYYQNNNFSYIEFLSNEGKFLRLFQLFSSKNCNELIKFLNIENITFSRYDKECSIIKIFTSKDTFKIYIYNDDYGNYLSDYDLINVYPIINTKLENFFGEESLILTHKNGKKSFYFKSNNNPIFNNSMMFDDIILINNETIKTVIDNIEKTLICISEYDIIYGDTIYHNNSEYTVKGKNFNYANHFSVNLKNNNSIIFYSFDDFYICFYDDVLIKLSNKFNALKVNKKNINKYIRENLLDIVIDSYVISEYFDIKLLTKLDFTNIYFNKEDKKLYYDYSIYYKVYVKNHYLHIIFLDKEIIVDLKEAKEKVNIKELIKKNIDINDFVELAYFNIAFKKIES